MEKCKRRVRFISWINSYPAPAPCRSGGAKKSTLLAGMSTAKPHGMPESGAPGKSPEAFGRNGQKTRGPWPKGGIFLGSGEAPRPPEATGAKRNCYMAKLKILPRSAEAELTGWSTRRSARKGGHPLLNNRWSHFFQSFPELEKLRLPPSPRLRRINRRERVS